MQPDRFSRYGRALLEVLFPTCCPACGNKLLSHEDTICDDCIHTFPTTEHATLPDNGVDMLFHELIKKDGHVVHYQQGAAFAYYNRQRGRLFRQLIEKGKFGLRPRPEIFQQLGKIAACDYINSDLYEDIDILVPVPLHPRRLRQRGFNQAEQICIGIQAVTHIPIDTQHLLRIRNNPHQSHTLFDKRMQNVQNLFHVTHPEEWKGKHILLVDDIITSGATLFECMKAITPVRKVQISVFALGWAHN